MPHKDTAGNPHASQGSGGHTPGTRSATPPASPTNMKPGTENSKLSGMATKLGNASKASALHNQNANETGF